MNSRRAGGGVLFADQLAHALVIEEHRHSTRANEYGDAVANQQGVGEINFKAVTADQFDCEGAKWLALSQRSEGVLKAIGYHVLSIPLHCGERQAVSVGSSQ